MGKSDETPHASRGWLRNGNPPGDLSNLPKCGAKTRLKGSCKSPAMRNGRCRMHGGKSTGPRTEEGKERISKANFKHGEYSQETLLIKKALKKFSNV